MSLRCDMDRACTSPVTHVDRKGYVYCTMHGLRRRADQPCRKLLAHEVRKLESGKPLGRY